MAPSIKPHPIRLRADVIAYCALLVGMATSGCVRTVQAWPPPLTSDTPVTVRLAQARTIAFEGVSGRDSVADVRELQGRVVYLHGDTLVLRVTHAPTAAGGARMVGRPATVRLDSATLVTRTEIDGWKLGYGILASAVLIFAGLVLSGG
jgi:hypothetical protein